MKTKQKLQALRAAMKTNGVAAFVQPVADEFMNEYPPANARRVEWLSGFAGSAGTVAVTEKKAAIFIDGRYTLQAETEVDHACFERHNIADLTPEAWLAKRVQAGDRVGYDPKLYTHDMVRRMAAKLNVVPNENLVDAIWHDRPAPPASKLFAHELKYSGEASQSKRKRVALQLKKLGADAAIITTPDAVCWLFNIRGHDVESAPLVLAPAIIGADGNAQLFVGPERCDKKLRAHLGKTVKITMPMQFTAEIKKYKGMRVLCDPGSAPVWYSQVLAEAGASIIEAQDPCVAMKAAKNETELGGMRAAHIRDGLAVTKLLYWLDWQSRVSEIEICEQLLKFRQAGEGFVEPSFSTIAGSGPHAAIVHYRVSDKTNRALKKGELFLLDSGGQYPDGTTDITRTIAIGEPTTEHKDRFTRVLKGHIALATAQFPAGTRGGQLDALARQFLWQAGLDYDHGTGHGVGCFLNVHEGPQRIGKRGGDAALVPGMVVSNEPGYYKTGEYGIRIESLVVVVEVPPSTLPPQAGGVKLSPPFTGGSKGGNACYLNFETITCAPIDRRLVDHAMLTPEEKRWLNAYHAWVFKMHSRKLNPAERAWLEACCAAV